jgi:soluble lytic murein transglycosylase-like protein
MRGTKPFGLFVASVMLALLAAPARAEIALLSNGMTLKVEAWGSVGNTLHLKLKDGGEVGVPRALVVGVVPDEIVEQVQEARRSGGDVETLLREAAARHGLDPGLVRAVVGVESAFRKDAISPKGALGLMQLMPATAASLGVTDAFDAAQNLDGGSRHLAALVQSYAGDLTKALAAYNAGAGAVARHGGVPPYRETQDYVAKVLKRYKSGS